MKKITGNVNLMLKADVKDPGKKETVVLYRCFGAYKPRYVPGCTSARCVT